MEFDLRLQQAFALMESKGLAKSTYSPPLFRLLWKLGAEIPPPPMAGFAFNALVMAGFFGVFWGFLMWLLQWGRQGTPIMAGVLFGLIMACYLRWSAKKRTISTWREFS